MDIYLHAKILRHVAFMHKALMMYQIVIAVFVCRLNGLVTSGQDSIIDILMNTAGLYILNEFDDIALNLFIVCRSDEKDGESVAIIDSKTEDKDRMFALSVCFAHFAYMIVYTVAFLTNIEGYNDFIQ